MDTDSFLRLMSPHITEDDGTMRLFEELDADTPSADFMRQQNPSSLSFPFESSIPKNQSLKNTNMTMEPDLSPGSSLRDSISNSSNERDSFGSSVRPEIVVRNGGTGSNNWTIAQYHQFPSRAAPDLANLEDSNRAMENHFDFDSAASSPGAEALDIVPGTRHIAIPNEESPMSLASPSIENVSSILFTVFETLF